MIKKKKINQTLSIRKKKFNGQYMSTCYSKRTVAGQTQSSKIAVYHICYYLYPQITSNYRL